MGYQHNALSNDGNWTSTEDYVIYLRHVKTTVFIIIALLNVLLNGLALFTLVSRKSSRPSVKFIYGICFKNLLLGTTLLVSIILTSAKTSISFHSSWCQISAILFVGYILISSWFVMLISFDRYVAIRKALQYSNWFTNRACFILIMVTIFVGFSVSSLQAIKTDSISYRTNLLICLADDNHEPLITWIWKSFILTILIIGFVLPFSSNCYIYGSIYIATKNTTALARRNSIQPLIDPNTVVMAENSRKSPTVVDGLLKTPKGNGLRRLSGQLRVHKDNRKAAVMGTLVVVDQVMVWTPFYLILTLQSFQLIQPSQYDWLVTMMVFMDTISNPIIYILRNKSSKAVIKSTCCMKEHSTQKQQTIQTQSTIVKHVASQLSDDSI